MSKGINRKLGVLTALALLAGSVGPVAAEESFTNQEFRIELDLEIGEPTPLAPREPIRIAALDVRSVRDVGLPAHGNVNRQQSAPAESKTKRTGRWLKKHWWVPTLVGVALGVALLEPFDDDDDERRRAQMNP